METGEIKQFDYLCQNIVMVDSSKKEFAERLNTALDLNNVPGKNFGRQTAVAKMFGITKAAARNWIEGDGMPRTKRIVDLAYMLNVNTDWLLTGNGPMTSDGVDHDKRDVHYMPRIRPVPKISWEIAAEWHKYTVEVIHDGKTLNSFAQCRIKHGPLAFTITVETDVMATKDSDTVPQGCQLIVDPDVKPVSGDFVVVASPGAKQAILRKYINDGAKEYLKITGENVPSPITNLGDSIIIGTVIERTLSRIFATKTQTF